MPGMPDLLVKAPVFGRFARASRLKDAHRNPLLDQMIARLQADPTRPENKLVQVAREMGFYKSDAQAEHVKRDWLNDPAGGGFWPSIDTESIMRAGLLAVCRKFKETGLPVEFFWVISGDQNTTRWEMTISQLSECLIVMFHTPQFPCFVPTAPSDSMWVVRRENGRVVTRPVELPVPPGDTQQAS